MNLTDQYNKGCPSAPPNGRYQVIMQIQGYRTVLEKKILNGKGSNYLPVVGLRYFKIPLMDFKVDLHQGEIRFLYDNGVLVDLLRKVSYNIWLGKIYWRNKFIDLFWLKRK